MRPPSEVERLAVFLAAMAVTRALLPRMKPTRTRPSSDYQLTADERREALARAHALRQQLVKRRLDNIYRARYGAYNAREN